MPEVTGILCPACCTPLKIASLFAVYRGGRLGEWPILILLNRTVYDCSGTLRCVAREVQVLFVKPKIHLDVNCDWNGLPIFHGGLESIFADCLDSFLAQPIVQRLDDPHILRHSVRINDH